MNRSDRYRAASTMTSRGAPWRRGSLGILALAILLTACGGDDAAEPDSVDSTTAATTAASESAATETTSSPATTGADGTCRVLEADLVEIDVVSPGTEVADVYVYVETGKTNGDRDEAAVRLNAMVPGEHAIHPFGIVGAVDSECVVTSIEAPSYFGERSELDVADVTLCEVVDHDGALGVVATLNNSGTNIASYIMTAGLYDSDGIRRHSVDTSISDAPPGEETIGRLRRVGVDYVDGLTCSINSVLRRPER